jgi:hypothetical protein
LAPCSWTALSGCGEKLENYLPLASGLALTASNNAGAKAQNASNVMYRGHCCLWRPAPDKDMRLATPGLAMLAIDSTTTTAGCGSGCGPFMTCMLIFRVAGGVKIADVDTSVAITTGRIARSCSHTRHTAGYSLAPQHRLRDLAFGLTFPTAMALASKANYTHEYRTL